VPFAAILFLTLSLPCAISAQGFGAFLRAGAGIDSAGGSVLGAQIELVDFGTSHSVEMALGIFEGRLVEDRRVLVRSSLGRDEPHDYHEDTRVRGAGAIASVLVGHGPRDSRGPYGTLGLGLGAFGVDWHIESPTDRFLGTARPTGGSLIEEDTLLLGGLGSLGLGFRVHRRLDVRAYTLMLLTPSTDTREDIKLLTSFMLTAGIGI
jgi:hypothetical protein